ncbi:hypothetical protein Pres01_51660 [Metapseudomonas resinovorans]|nr:hypothetical protein Pres01_51660 [Pseudomonas resinovorans]
MKGSPLHQYFCVDAKLKSMRRTGKLALGRGALALAVMRESSRALRAVHLLLSVGTATVPSVDVTIEDRESRREGLGANFRRVIAAGSGARSNASRKRCNPRRLAVLRLGPGGAGPYARSAFVEGEGGKGEGGDAGVGEALGAA